MVSRNVIIIGAGAAGSSTATTLAQLSPDTKVVVIGSENRRPYNRTTVNKGLLSGAVTDGAITLPDATAPGIRWIQGETVDEIDAHRRTVTVRSGQRLEADAIVIATGATPRNLPVEVTADARSRVMTLRTAEDTHRLRTLALGDTPGRVLIACAGLIGTETATVLREAGCDVTLVDPGSRPFSRHVGRTVADWIAGVHKSAGVNLRTGTSVSAVQTDGGDLMVRLSDGTDIRTDVVLVAIGVTHDIDWLKKAGLPLETGSRDGGLLTDRYQRVLGIPGVYAAGDIAAPPGPDGHPTRVEHWGAAVQQGRRAAETLLADLGVPTGAVAAAASVETLPAPSYSTYVHGTKLTILGWPRSGLTEHPVLGVAGDPRFAVALLDDQERIVAAVGVGGARAVNQLRHDIERRVHLTEIAPAADGPN